MTNWLSADEMRAWRAFIGTNADLLGALEADLALQGVDLGDYQVLVYLSEAEGNQMRMCDLADQLQQSAALRVSPGEGVLVRHRGRDLALDWTVAHAGVEALDRIDVRFVREEE